MARTGDDITAARADVEHLNTLGERADRSRGATTIPEDRSSRGHRCRRPRYSSAEEASVRIAVTGATGVLGQEALEALVAAGHEVTGVTRRDSGVPIIEGREIGRASCRERARIGRGDGCGEDTGEAADGV